MKGYQYVWIFFFFFFFFLGGGDFHCDFECSTPAKYSFTVIFIALFLWDWASVSLRTWQPLDKDMYCFRRRGFTLKRQIWLPHPPPSGCLEMVIWPCCHPSETTQKQIYTRGNFVNGIPLPIKGIDRFWSCDCIVKETLWNRSEKVDHLQRINIGVYCKVLESSK